MTIPNYIPFNLVELRKRVRQTYDGIDDLIIGIDTMGLIHPIILRFDEETKTWVVVDGGRRYTALLNIGCEGLYHATSCVRGQPGFLIKGEASGDRLMNLLTEISANKDREEIPWQQELPAIVEAWKLVEAQHHLRGEEITMRAFGSMLGVTYHDLQAAVKIWDSYCENPVRFSDCPSVRGALSLMLRDASADLAKAHMRSATEHATLPVAVQPGPQQVAPVSIVTSPTAVDKAAPITVNLHEMFKCVDSMTFMKSMPTACVNHIITDPDYAISVDALSSNSVGAAGGVAQTSVEESLNNLYDFISEAFRIVDDHGFLVFWFDLEHFEKLRDHCLSIGWRVQRWPLTWRVSDRRSNSAPNHNFCKNQEWAMVCRKPGAVLNQAQMSSVYDCASGDTIKQFNHPFAKPVKVWHWIMAAICVKGQSVYDPFLGSGSSAAAAITLGLRPLGTEISSDHHANALINMRIAYTNLFGPNTNFI